MNFLMGNVNRVEANWEDVGLTGSSYKNKRSCLLLNLSSKSFGCFFRSSREVSTD